MAASGSAPSSCGFPPAEHFGFTLGHSWLRLGWRIAAWQVSRETYAQCAFFDESSLFVARILPNVFIFTLEWQKGAQTYENRRNFGLRAYATAKFCHESLEFRGSASKSYVRRKFCYCLVLWLGRAPFIRVDFFSRVQDLSHTSREGRPGALAKFTRPITTGSPRHA